MLFMHRKTFFLLWILFFTWLPVGGVSGQDSALEASLNRCYGVWRNAVVKKDFRAWSASISERQKVQIRNRIVSERRKYPAAVFELPVAPPSLVGLKALRVRQSGATATAVYYGEVDFGVGGEPSKNLLLLEFLSERGSWKYDRAEFISLAGLPAVRKQLEAGDMTYVDQADFKPSGQVPEIPMSVAPAKYIAKVYVFCPGREVKLKVNRVSDHRFQDTKAAEVVLGGGLDGLNEIQFAVKSLEGSNGKEPLVMRVYLMSTVKGVAPIKMYEYKVAEGGVVKPYGSSHFTIGPKEHARLSGK